MSCFTANDEVEVASIEARLFGADFSMIVSSMRTDIGTRMGESAAGAAGAADDELLAARAEEVSTVTDADASGVDTGTAGMGIMAGETCTFSPGSVVASMA